MHETKERRIQIIRKGRRPRPGRTRALYRIVGAVASGLLLMSAATGFAYGADKGSSTQNGNALGSGPCAPTRQVNIPQATPEELEAAGYDKLPLAPMSARVDLVAPPFSNPTSITNPLFPIGDLHSAILNGTVDGKPFKTETTLLPETRILKWAGDQCIEALVSQYLAYSDGRIKEVALDLYAQADDGSVWYLGEDVFNYEGGLIADTEGTWFAGREGPAAMIMAADPQVGDAFRPENVPGLVFEEVTIKSVNQTVQGPHGPVDGAIVTSELHQNGTTEEKVFAPRYGEFFTGSGGDREALALAVPTDAIDSPQPDELDVLSSAPDDIFSPVAASSWGDTSKTAKSLNAAWNSYRKTNDVPIRLKYPMARALKRLNDSITNRHATYARTSAIEVAQVALDLGLQYRDPVEIDIARFDLWARSTIVDAAAESTEGVRSDVAILEWVRDRFASSVDKIALTRIDVQLLKLRESANDEDMPAAATAARDLRNIVKEL